MSSAGHEVAIALRTIHLATLAACWRLDAGPEAGTDAGADLAVAAYWCAEQAPRAVRTCHHLHGGLGMDATYPMHRFRLLVVADSGRYLGGAEALLRAGMSIDLTAGQRALRAELRAYFAALLTPADRAALLTERHGEAYRDVVRRMGRDAGSSG